MDSFESAWRWLRGEAADPALATVRWQRRATPQELAETPGQLRHVIQLTALRTAAIGVGLVLATWFLFRLAAPGLVLPLGPLLLIVLGFAGLIYLSPLLDRLSAWQADHHALSRRGYLRNGRVVASWRELASYRHLAGPPEKIELHRRGGGQWEILLLDTLPPQDAARIVAHVAGRLPPAEASDAVAPPPPELSTATTLALFASAMLCAGLAVMLGLPGPTTPLRQAARHAQACFLGGGVAQAAITWAWIALGDPAQRPAARIWAIGFGITTAGLALITWLALMAARLH